MKGRKLVFLLLALILPVAIFIFLKVFGRNEFHVPVMHEQTVEHAADCGFEYSAPYLIHDSVATFLKISHADSLYVIYFQPSLSVQVKRVSVEFASDPIGILSPRELSEVHVDQEILRKCILLMPSPHSIALLDNRRRIRGYYDGTDRDDVDRLIVEMKIILKRY
jgi:hypothetical protein